MPRFSSRLTRRMTIPSLLLMAALAVTLTAQGPRGPRNGKDGKSLEPVPVVVELFTSEGCSSCPPADQILARLGKGGNQGLGGAEVIVLGEHVDYWDYLGWRDEFSSPLFSARQQNYGRAMHAANIYTPQMVFNGRIEALGSDFKAVSNAIASAARESRRNPDERTSVNLRMLNDDDFEVRVGALPESSHGADLLLAIAEDDLSTAVSAGENEGRRLQHAAVVRTLLKLGELDRDSQDTDGEIHVTKARLNLRKEWKQDNLRLVVLVQDRESREIFGAAQLGLHAVKESKRAEGGELSFVFFELELIARLRPGLIQRSRRQLQHRVRQQAERNPALGHVRADLADLALFVEKHHVDRELHREGVDPLARNDPQAFARLQASVLQQAGAALGAGVGDVGTVRQFPIPSQIPDPQLRHGFGSGFRLSSGLRLGVHFHRPGFRLGLGFGLGFHEMTQVLLVLYRPFLHEPLLCPSGSYPFRRAWSPGATRNRTISN